MFCPTKSQNQKYIFNSQWLHCIKAANIQDSKMEKRSLQHEFGPLCNRSPEQSASLTLLWAGMINACMEILCIVFMWLYVYISILLCVVYWLWKQISFWDNKSKSEVINNVVVFCLGCGFQFFWGTCTLLEHFHFLQLYTSTPLQFRGKYCTFYSTTCISWFTLQIRISNTKNIINK